VLESRIYANRGPYVPVEWDDPGTWASGREILRSTFAKFFETQFLYQTFEKEIVNTAERLFMQIVSYHYIQGQALRIGLWL
jgi:hypothetical protein